MFHFPANQIPWIDGKVDDWAIDRKDLEVKVNVGRVTGRKRLYLLDEASDHYWDCSDRNLHHEIFEWVVDGSLSGGPFITHMPPVKE